MTQGVLTVVGQGYVGLPLARAAIKAGWTVRGYDTSTQRVLALNSGRSDIDDISDDMLSEMIALGYIATTDPIAISDAEVVVVCVPTPLGDAGAPDLRAVEASARVIGEHISAGALVILESTTYPGTTEDLFLPLVEEFSGLTIGTDLDGAFSPERVDPGNKEFGIKNTPKLVGGATTKSGHRAAAFYSGFVDEVVLLSGTREAEMAKLLENTFRHVNIALVNEMAKFSYELGIDIWEVIKGAATKPFGFMKFTPGPGVGGHCIPIDPNYLSYEVRKELGYPFRFVELAQEINRSMPRYVVSRSADLLNEDGKPLKGSKILILGVTYKPNVADLRESPSLDVGEILLGKGVELMYHDPFVETWEVGDVKLERVANLSHALNESDLVLLLQPHSAYELSDLASRSRLFFDAAGASTAEHRL